MAPDTLSATPPTPPEPETVNEANNIITQATEELNALREKLKEAGVDVRAVSEQIQRKIGEIETAMQSKKDTVKYAAKESWRQLQETLDTVRYLPGAVEKNVRTRIESASASVQAGIAEVLEAQEKEGWVSAIGKSAETSIDSVAALFGAKPDFTRRTMAAVSAAAGKSGKWTRRMVTEVLPTLIQTWWHGMWAKAVNPDGSPTLLATIFGIDPSYHQEQLRVMPITRALTGQIDQYNAKYGLTAGSRYLLPPDWNNSAVHEQVLKRKYDSEPKPKPSYATFVAKQFALAASRMPGGGEVTMSRMVKALERIPGWTPPAPAAASTTAPGAPAPAPSSTPSA